MVDFETRVTPNETVVIKLNGQLDKPSCHYVFDNVDDILDAGRKLVVIDCDDLDDVSGDAFEMLLRCRSRVRRRGSQIVLAGIQNDFARFLAWLNIDRIFNIYPTAHRAVHALETRFQLAKV